MSQNIIIARARGWLQRSWGFLVVGVAIVIILRFLWLAGFPATHDGEGHLARAANYSVALRQGQWPPRWAPAFQDGFGYPIFNYHYPLLSILITPLLYAQLPVEFAAKIILTSTIILAAIGCWLWLRSWSSRTASVLGTLAWLTAPYLLVNLYVRGTFGEVVAYESSFWLLAAVEYLKTADSKWQKWLWRLLWWGYVICLLLAHNLLAVILAPLVALYAMWRWELYKLENWRRYAIEISLGVLAGFTTLFFWLPALLEKNLVRINTDVLPKVFDHTVALPNLITSAFTYGYSFTAPVDTVSMSVGLVAVVAIVFAIGWWMARAMIRRSSSLPSASLPTKLQSIALVTILISLWLISPASNWFWMSVPSIGIFQFPWRLLGLIAVASTILVAWLVDRGPKWLSYFFGVLLAIQLLQWWSVSPPARIHFADEYYYGYTQTTTVFDEARPVTYTKPNGDLSQQRPLPASPADVQTLSWSGSKHHYRITANENTWVVEPTAFFPGWETRVDGQKIAIDPTYAQGQIAYQVPAGEYEVITRFTQNTWPRLIGNGVSVLAFSLSFAIFIFLGRRS
jgi:hypothetical protein